MSHFIGDLDVRLVAEHPDGTSTWELVSDFGFHSDAMGMDIIARAGERTDFASVPRVPLLFLAAGDRGHKAAVIHDHLYSETPHSMNRLAADNILKEALICEGFTEEEAQTWWFAVRLGGGGHWDAHLTVAAVCLSTPPSP